MSSRILPYQDLETEFNIDIMMIYAEVVTDGSNSETIYVPRSRYQIQANCWFLNPHGKLSPGLGCSFLR